MRRTFLWAVTGLAIVATTANAGLFGPRCNTVVKMKVRRAAFVPLPATPVYAVPIYRYSVPVPQTYGECIPGVGCPAPIPQPEKGSVSVMPKPLRLVDYKFYDDPGLDLEVLVASNRLY